LSRREPVPGEDNDAEGWIDNTLSLSIWIDNWQPPQHPQHRRPAFRPDFDSARTPTAALISTTTTPPFLKTDTAPRTRKAVHQLTPDSDTNPTQSATVHPRPSPTPLAPPPTPVHNSRALPVEGAFFYCRTAEHLDNRATPFILVSPIAVPAFVLSARLPPYHRLAVS